MNPKLVPGQSFVGLYSANASSMNRLTTALLVVPFFVLVPMRRPICPCSKPQFRMGTYSHPNSSRCLSRRYSVNETVFQSSMSRLRQSLASGRRLVIRFTLQLIFTFEKANVNTSRCATLTFEFHIIHKIDYNFIVI